MSLCPMSWRSIKRLARQTDKRLVHASAHHGGDVYAVDMDGTVWFVTRRGKVPVSVERSDTNTTSSSWLRGEHDRMSDEFAAELRRRVAWWMEQT